MKYPVVKSALILTGASLTAVLLWNAILALLVLQHPTMIHDDVWGVHYPAYADVMVGTEGYAHVKMDQYGFNNTDAVYQGHGQRLVMLGDSHTESLQVPRAANFSSRLAQKLGDGFQVINLGVGDNSMANHMYIAPQVQKVLHPDLVVLQVTSDDFYVDAVRADKSIRLVPDRQGFAVQTHFALSPLQQMKQRLKSSPVAATILESSFTKYAFNRLVKWRGAFGGSENTAVAAGEQPGAQPDVPAIIDFEMQTLAHVFPRVVVVYLPMTPYMNGRKVIFDESQDAVAIKSLVNQKAAALGWGFIDMSGSFAQAYTEQAQMTRGFDNTRPGVGHLNSYGHQLVADALHAYVHNYLKEPKPL